MKRLLIALLIGTSFACTSEPQKKTSPQKKSLVEKATPTSLTFGNKVEFYKKGKVSKTVDVALAAKPEERNQGLMGVSKLDINKGMLFIFEKNQPLSFWMANTPLSLDIIFVNADYKIVRIHSNTEPFSTKQYDSSKPAKYVIEVNGGYCIENDILEGTEVGFDI